MNTMKLDLQQMPAPKSGDAVIRLNGKLSLETVNSFIQTLRQEPARHLVLDLSGVSFLDSAGVGALVSIFVSRKNAGKTMVLAALAKQSIAVLQVSGLLKLIPTYPTVEEALNGHP
jgi:anti-anti-sigma factor